MIYVSYLTCFNSDLNNDKERFLAFLGNGLNVIAASSFNKALLTQVIGSGFIFLYFHICKKNDFSHAIWHLTCHAIIYQYFNECYLFQLSNISSSFTSPYTLLTQPLNSSFTSPILTQPLNSSLTYTYL
jgi:hypothetical protein